MKRSAVALALLLASAPGCEAPASGPAGRCAEVVRVYRDLQGAVAVVGTPRESDAGVEIQYEGSDGMNLPVTGTAVCSFRNGASGRELAGAVVDGAPLDEAEIESTRRRLGGA